MKTKSICLTKEERAVLILSASRYYGKSLSNAEISKLLGVSTNKVKTLIHQASTKLGAQNRYEAILIALRKGDIKLTDFWSLNELAELYSSIHPDTLRRMAKIASLGPEGRHLLGRNKQNVYNNGRRPDAILTNSERDVLVLAGCHGLTNKEIAKRLFISVGSVRIFLNRAYTKLGANNRADAFILALKQREISLDEICSFNDLLRYAAPMGSDLIEKLARLVEQKVWQEPVYLTVNTIAYSSAAY